MKTAAPRDREGAFEPKTVRQRQKPLPGGQGPRSFPEKAALRRALNAFGITLEGRPSLSSPPDTSTTRATPLVWQLRRRASCRWRYHNPHRTRRPHSFKITTPMPYPSPTPMDRTPRRRGGRGGGLPGARPPTGGGPGLPSPVRVRAFPRSIAPESAPVLREA